MIYSLIFGLLSLTSPDIRTYSGFK